MKIELTKIPVKDIFDQFEDKGEEGVTGYHGQLVLRPKYQRDFVYSEDKQIAVIESVLQGFPINTMYWAKARNDQAGDPILTDDGKQVYELLDGQQRTMSICYFLMNKFSVNALTAYNLKVSKPDLYEKIMNYELQVYICDGTTSEKLSWFRTVNIAGVPLTEQELLNAQYTGEWLTSAKEYFSKSNGGAPEYIVIPNHTARQYIKFGKNEGIDRQSLLQKAILWATDHDNLPKRTENGDYYMSTHQADKNADALISYYNSVFDWVGSKFKDYYKEEKGQDWGLYFNNFQNNKYAGNLINKDGGTIAKKIQSLMANEEVQNKRGIYKYILTNEEKYLNLRQFDETTARSVYAQQKGRCPYCDENIDNHTYPTGQESEQYGKNTYEFNQMEADHKKPFAQGGKTNISNCQMLCRWHNRHKGNNE